MVAAIMFSIPKIFDAYVGTNSIYPKMNESVMLAVNSVNNCPYCDMLHGNLGRIAGIPVKTVDEMLAAKDSDECASLVESPEEKAAVKYARIFAERNGREDSAAFKVLAEVANASSFTQMSESRHPPYLAWQHPCTPAASLVACELAVYLLSETGLRVGYRSVTGQLC